MASAKPGVWGIDLGQCALKAIRLESIEGNVTATAFDYIEHPKILSQPDADPDQLTREALEQFLSRNKLQGDMVVISVPGQSGLARFVKLPPVEEKKIADIVKFEAKQQIPFPLEEVVWDFQKIGSGLVTDGFAMETEIGLFAMKRDMVNRYLQHFKDVNVEVHVVQMSPLALCNFVSYDLLGKDTASPGEEGADKKQCVVALDIGTDNSNLVITDGEKIIWQRPIPLGGNHFTRALTKDLKLTFAKAEHLKRNAVKSPDLKKILSSLKTVLNDFVGEVQRSLGYFTNTHRDAQIQYMVGLGNAFRLPGLQKFLQEKLQLEVRKLSKLERLSGEEVLAAPQFTENILSFGVAYGLALQGLKLPRLQTNLLPYEIRVERLVRAKKPWAAAAAAALLLAAAGLTFARNMEYQTVDPKNKSIVAALEEAKSQEARAKFESQYGDADGRYKKSIKSIIEISAGAGQRFNWNLLYQYVNMSLPSPDGKRLSTLTRTSVDAYKKYYLSKPEAKEANDLVVQKRFAKAVKGKPAKKSALTERSPAEVDEFIKKFLIQVNIEGIDCLYFDDLSGYFKKIEEEQPELPGMEQIEREKVKAHKDLPKKGWVVEIRGYTHHWDLRAFVENTLLENMFNPEALSHVVDGKQTKVTLSKEMEEKVKKRISYLWVMGHKVVNPDPAKFKFIDKAFLGHLKDAGGGGGEGKGGLVPGGKAAPMMGDKGGGKGGKGDSKRSGWNSIGEIAGSLFGGGKFGGKVDGNRNFMFPQGGQQAAPKENTPAAKGGPGELTPRTEFIILFIWQEPTLGETPANTAKQ